MLEDEGAVTKNLFFVVVRDDVRLGADILAEIFKLARKSNRDLTWVWLARHPMLVRLDDVAWAGGVEDMALTASARFLHKIAQVLLRLETR